MRYLIIAILLGFPLLEGTVLYQIGKGHAAWVVAWLLLAATMGVVLIKEARFALVARLTIAVAQGKFSLAALIDSGRTVLAGLLLIFPGVISDVMAMFLLLLPVRSSDRDLAYPLRRGAIEGEFKRES